MDEDRPERATKAVSVSMDTGMTGSMGAAAPIGAVSRRTRVRAGRTSLRREDPSALLLLTAVPGTALLQRRATDGTWETLERRPASRLGRTRIELPRQGAPSAPFRVVFSPRNPHLASWVSPAVDA